MPATTCSPSCSGRLTALVKLRSLRSFRKSWVERKLSRDKETMATKTKSEPKQNIGKIVQVIGPVLDVEFEPEQLPELYNAVTVKGDGGTLVAEVEQHIGRNQVRAVAMSSTDGVVRGMEVVDTGKPITVPV